jgi:lipopolysaccharide transport system ATP-binding protein
VLLDKGQLVGFGRSNEIVDQYHAMLYADQETYLRLTRQSTSAAADVVPAKEIAKDPGATVPASDRYKTETGSGDARAAIQNVRLLNEKGEDAELFRPRERAKITVRAICQSAVPELQFGISIKTVEGVHAFGTSTLYEKLNVVDARPGDVLEAEFDLELSLCEGVYFVSVAIAETITSAEMSYLDKRTDTLAFRVAEPRVTASGIAKLPHHITIKRS